MLERLLMLAPMLVLLGWAAWADCRTRTIRNWLTASLAAAGLTSSFLAGSAITPAQALLGMLVGFGLMFVLFILGALGGGDVKLLAALGTWLGPTGITIVFALAAVVGMLIVLAQSICQGRLTALLRNSAVLAVNLAHVSDVGVRHAAETGQSCRSVERPLPYAVPVLLAAVAYVLIR